MKTFAQFISEGTSKKTLESDQFLDYLNAHCSDFATPWSKGKRIYRGSTGMYDALPPSKSSDSFGGLIIDTSSTTRKSRVTKNYYTLFLDYLIEKGHSDFPLRSKSIISTSSKATAKSYGAGLYLVIIPTNGCKIGEISAEDIWDLKASIGGNTSVGITNINNQLSRAGVIESIDSIKEKSDEYKKMSEKELHKELLDSEPYFINAAKNGLFDAFTSYYTQILDQCKSYTPSNFTTSGIHEVWVGNGDVVVFNSENLEKTNLIVKNGKWEFE